MRTLILTCNTGQGHNSSAGAICQVYEQNGEFCELQDSLKFSSKRFSKIIGKGHTSIYRHSPKLFDKGYAMSEKHDSFFAEGSLLYKLLTRGVKKLYEYVKENEIDNIICTHPFAALLVTELIKISEKPLQTSLVATDYTCAPSTNSSKLDKYFIPHSDLKDEFCKCGIPREKLYASGIPINQSFFEKSNKENARSILNLPNDKKILVMCCGSMGCGPMEKVAEKILKKLDEETVMILVCGSNKRLYNKMQPKQTDNFLVIGYTNQMYEYMVACDVFVTKPGGISTTECSALHKPMVFVNAVAGCELHNREFFEKIDCAVAVADNDEIPDAVVNLLSDDERRNVLSENIRRELFGNAAKYIYDELSKIKEVTF
ncbi:MAG: glycosyltransferase [Clostridia bacterium]|nr:glycosyltransferase [Clostridia bacterium]